MPPERSDDPRGAATRLEAAVAARIAPTPEFLARVARCRTDLVERATAIARERGSPLVRALVAGSAARGTFLQDRLDVDLFLLFPPELTRERLRAEGLAIGRALLTDPVTRYAEHPYLRGSFDGFPVDAVPGYAVADPSRPLSPVDRTPFHQEYLAGRETPELVRDVRLAKQFLRALEIYGSEAKTEGLSGYLVELLVLRAGSFHGWLEEAGGWSIPARLSPPGAEPPRLPEDVALVLADPVDLNRNVASALSRKNLATLILSAREYLQAPTEGWFERRPSVAMPKAEALRRVMHRGTHVTVVELPRPDLVDDTLFPQVRKAERTLAEEAGRLGFEVLGRASAVGRQRLLFGLELAHAERPGVRYREGPPAGIARTSDFLEKWRPDGSTVLQGPYLRSDGSLAVETDEPVRSAEAALGQRIPSLSLGRHLTATAASPFQIRPLAETPESEELSELLRSLLAKRLPWPGPPSSDK